MRGQHDKKGAAPIPMRARPRSHPIPPQPRGRGRLILENFTFFYARCVATVTKSSRRCKLVTIARVAFAQMNSPARDFSLREMCLRQLLRATKFVIQAYANHLNIKLGRAAVKVGVSAARGRKVRTADATKAASIDVFASQQPVIGKSVLDAPSYSVARLGRRG